MKFKHYLFIYFNLFQYKDIAATAKAADPANKDFALFISYEGIAVTSFVGAVISRYVDFHSVSPNAATLTSSSTY